MTELIHLSAGALAANGRERTPTEQANLAVVLSAYDALTGGDSAAIDTFYHPDYRDHASTVRPGDLYGFKEFIAKFQKEFPDSTIMMKRVLADGAFVVAHTWGRRGSNDDWDGIMEIFRLDDGRIIEHWEVIEPADFADSNPSNA
jgi:predicted SnoaL-like aldol condensation-catalyzing enzyme